MLFLLFAKEKIKYGKTELYCDTGSHALAFDGKGNLYIAESGKNIWINIRSLWRSAKREIFMYHYIIGEQFQGGTGTGNDHLMGLVV